MRSVAEIMKELALLQRNEATVRRSLLSEEAKEKLLGELAVKARALSLEATSVQVSQAIEATSDLKTGGGSKSGK